MDKDKIIEDLYDRIEHLEKNLNNLYRLFREYVNEQDRAKFYHENVDVQFNLHPIITDENFEFKSLNPKRSQIDEISMYIVSIIDKAIAQGFDNVVIRSGEVHRSLNLVQRIPSVCNAMRKIAESDPRIAKSEVIKDTPSHNSSTYTMKYYLK